MATNPWDLWRLWARNARMGAELTKATQFVVDHRSKMLRDAATNPLGADYFEMWLMGAEKVAAFTAAGAAAATDWSKLQRGWMSEPAEMARLTATTWSRAMKPIHAAATANERRLRRKKKR